MPRDHVDRWDVNRCYVLPHEVLTNIPHHQALGSLGAHEVARGLLVEICRYTDATPVALRYAEDELRDPATRDLRDLTILLTFTAVVTLPDGNPLTVVTRYRQHPSIDRDDDWSIQLNDVVLSSESRRYPPTPPYQGLLVGWYVRRPDAYERERGRSRIS